LPFPPTKTTEKRDIVEFFGCPEENVKNRAKQDKVPYDVWARDGFIVPTPAA
jgi:hypothetical protein